MSDDLTAAAEYIRDGTGYKNYEPDFGFITDAKDLAADYLRRAEGDAEPVTNPAACRDVCEAVLARDRELRALHGIPADTREEIRRRKLRNEQQDAAPVLAAQLLAALRLERPGAA